MTGTKYYASMNGGSSQINVGADESLANLIFNDFTVELWIKPSPVTSSFETASLVTKDDGGWTDGWAIFLDRYQGYSDDIWAFTGRSGVYSRVYSYEVLAQSEWSHLAFVWDASEYKWWIAVNGVWVTQYHREGSGDLGYDTGVDMRWGNDGFAIANPAPLADFSWIRISSGLRYTPDTEFTPPDLEIEPDIDGTTLELWALNDNSDSISAEVDTGNDGVATDITWGILLEGDPVVTPDCRTLAIEAESRTLVIDGLTGNAITILENEPDQYFANSYWGDRYWGGLYFGVVIGAISVTTPTERTLTIEAQDRTLSILACTDGG